MTLMKRKEKKSRKLRGSRTCGYGRERQHRKKGRRGGFGKAGGHKHKWSFYVKYDPEYFGRGARGFKRPAIVSKRPLTINIGDIEENLDELIAKGLVKNVDGKILLSRELLGNVKIIGRGRVTHAYHVKGLEISRIAREKIIQAGGMIEE
uniref:Large ribosomal subunit protein uL15 n=1 Tax=uncultured korarchaeote TaxID=161241 RepID=A0A1L2JK74_9CREN|nr:ribosomal protein L15 [uncultured korarchaeote]